MSEELERRFLKLEDDYEVFKKKVLRHLANKNLHGRVDIKEATENGDRDMADGLKGKYRLEHADGSPVDPEGQYFVLKLNSKDPAHAQASQAALRTYADAIDSANPELAKDLRLVSADAALGREPDLWRERVPTPTEPLREYRLVVDARQGCGLIFNVGALYTDDAYVLIRAWLRGHPQIGDRVFTEHFDGDAVGDASYVGILRIEPGRGATSKETEEIHRAAGSLWGGGEKRFPIQGGLTVSWEAAEHAYMTYYKFYGKSQTIERLAERGGFGLHEFVLLYMGKRGTESLNGMENRIAAVLAKADVRSTRRS